MKLDGSIYNGAYEDLIGRRLPLVNVWKKDSEGNYYQTEETLQITPYTYYNLERAIKHSMRYKGDFYIAVDGDEGSGKTTLGFQLAKVVCAIVELKLRQKQTFDSNNLCFSATEFTKKCFELPDWSPIVLDESREAANRKRTMSRQNVTLTNFISQARILHKFPIIILPSIYDLDKYVAEHRIKMLFHVVEKWNRKERSLTKGHYMIYGKNGIKKLFLYCSKQRNYDVRSNAPMQDFTGADVLDMARYDKMKLEAVEKFRPTEAAPVLSKEEIIREYVKTRLHELKDTLPSNVRFSIDVPAVFGISKRTMYNYLGESEEVQ